MQLKIVVEKYQIVSFDAISFYLIKYRNIECSFLLNETSLI